MLNDFIPKSFSIKSRLKSASTIDNKGEIEKIIKKIIDKNKKAVEDYKAGEQNALNFLMGQIMKESNRRADYKTARQLLQKLI